MSWNEYHFRSERLASEAELALRAGRSEDAERLYREASMQESNAFKALSSDKPRTRGITAVSAVALSYKGHDFATAEGFAHQYLLSPELPTFAITQLRGLLNLIWTTSAAAARGLRFLPGDVLVSVKGGEVIEGGAPLDLILRKVEGIQAVLFRTLEMLLDVPFRRRGGPSAEIQNVFRPWLFQAPAGSYQFAVRMQEPAQRELWETERPKAELVTATFFRVLRASATDPEAELQAIVPDAQYRGAFLSLSRNLAPTGRTFDRLDITSASAPAEPVVTLAPETRQELNVALRKIRPPRKPADESEPIRMQGILRAVHLDQDWLEIARVGAEPVRIDEAGEALDDVIGPMVNRKVIVTVIERGNKHLYRDIESDE